MDKKTQDTAVKVVKTATKIVVKGTKLIGRVALNALTVIAYFNDAK